MVESLRLRLLFWVWVVTSTATLFFTAITITSEYLTEVEQVQGSAIQAGHMSLSSLSLAMWEFNDPIIQAQLKGIMNVKNVAYVELTEDDGRKRFHYGEDKHGPQYGFQVFYQNEHLGDLKIVIDKSSIVTGYLKKALMTFIGQTIKTFFVSFILLWLFTRMVSRHLFTMINFFKGYKRVKGRRLQLDRHNYNDDLSRLVLTVNSMITDIEFQHEDLERTILQRTEGLNKTIQELQKTKALLQEQEKMAAMGSMMAGLAHEIKNPLNLMNNAAKIVEELFQEHQSQNEKLPTGFEEMNELCKIISRNGDRLDRLIKTMSLQSRNPSSDRQEVNLSDFIREHLELARENYKASNFIHIDTELIENISVKVKLLPVEFGRALINLFENSFYALSKRDTTRSDPACLKIRIEEDDTYFIIMISDSADGISAVDQPHVFEPFFTTKPPGHGVGLGLSLVYDTIVNKHNGEITVTSTPSVGTTFTLKLPKHLF